jgi:SAM-dependent methyltransferase
LTGFRGWVRGLIADRRRAIVRGPDGQPVPPPELISLVAGYDKAEAFLEDSRRSVQSLIEIMARSSLDLDKFDCLLDFGCGCGRLIRGLATLKHCRVHGTDYNRRLVKWCRRNLGFAHFKVNRLEPPLGYPDDQFDFVYCLSVFTHLPEALQSAWISELRRVLKPGGYLLVTTHGDRYLEHLNADEKVRYHAGEMVVREPDEAGTNRCATFHPLRYVQEKLLSAFEAVDFVPEGNRLVGHQDVYVVRKPGGRSTPAR